MQLPHIQTLRFQLADRILPLRAMGNPALLEPTHPRVALIGSRNATPHQLTTAETLAKMLVAAGVTIVSGGARGIDEIGHGTALRAGGSTMMVLAQGLASGWQPSYYLYPCLDWERLLVVSQFADHAGWKAPHAFQRNLTIAQLSDVVVAVAAQEQSGSMSMIRETLRMEKPLFVPVFEGDEMPAGNRLALEQGALPIHNTPSGPNLIQLVNYLKEIAAVA